jgi:hypothetical protein
MTMASIIMIDFVVVDIIFYKEGKDNYINKKKIGRILPIIFYFTLKQK